MKRLLPLLALVPISPLAAQPFTVEATQRGYATLSDAVTAIGNGEGSILIAPGVYKDCVIQSQGQIAYRAAQPGTVIFDGTVCEGKAVLVLRGRGASVDGITFRNLRVGDGNGAGIRVELGGLTVRRSVFRDSEEGILGNDDPAADVRVEDSTFSGLGRCDRDLPCAHSIYIGDYRSVTVLRSRFERGQGGHYLKSRSGHIEVSDSSFDDTRGHATNYMVDLPAGATGVIRRNIFVQGADKENHSAIIAVAAETRADPSAGLEVTDNRADQVKGISWPTALVADWSRSKMVIERNVIGGRINLYQGVEPLPDKPGRWSKLRYYLGRLKEKLLG